MKKTTYILTGVFAASLFLVGCNTDTEVDNPAPEDVVVEDENDGFDMDGDMFEEEEPATTAFGFTHLDMTASYEGMGENYEVYYEHKTDEVHAEIDDARTGMKLEGDEAYTELEGIFQSLNINSMMTEEEILRAVIDGFNLDESYEKLEVKITFEDGTEVDVEHDQENNE